MTTIRLRFLLAARGSAARSRCRADHLPFAPILLPLRKSDRSDHAAHPRVDPVLRLPSRGTAQRYRHSARWVARGRRVEQTLAHGWRHPAAALDAAAAHGTTEKATDAAGLHARTRIATQHLRQRRPWLLARHARTAGGVNVFADVAAESVQVSSELILARAPDVILELRRRTSPPAGAGQPNAVLGALASVPAVRTGRVLCCQAAPRVPGPASQRAPKPWRAPSRSMKILVSWSSGQGLGVDAHVLHQHSRAVAGLLTTINEAFDRVAMHAVRRTLLEAQAAAAGLPLFASTSRGRVPTKSTNSA